VDAYGIRRRGYQSGAAQAIRTTWSRPRTRRNHWPRVVRARRSVATGSPGRLELSTVDDHRERRSGLMASDAQHPVCPSGRPACASPSQVTIYGWRT